MVDGDCRAAYPKLLLDPFQRGVGMPVHVLGEPVGFVGSKATRLAHPALAWGEAAASLALTFKFMHPPRADFEPFGDLAPRPLVLIVGLQHPLPQI